MFASSPLPSGAFGKGGPIGLKVNATLQFTVNIAMGYRHFWWMGYTYSKVYFLHCYVSCWYRSRGPCAFYKKTDARGGGWVGVGMMTFFALAQMRHATQLLEKRYRIRERLAASHVTLQSRRSHVEAEAHFTWENSGTGLAGVTYKFRVKRKPGAFYTRKQKESGRVSRSDK